MAHNGHVRQHRSLRIDEISPRAPSLSPTFDKARQARARIFHPRSKLPSVLTNSSTMPIILGIVLPFIACVCVCIYLHRRYIARQRREDKNDPHKSLDFGIDLVRKLSRKGNKLSKKGANIPPAPVPHTNVTDFDKDGRRGRGMSMDMDMVMASPYILPGALGGSRESIHSMSRSMRELDPYRPIALLASDSASASARNSSRRGDNMSIRTGLTALTHSSHSTDHVSASLLKNANSMPQSRPPRGDSLSAVSGVGAFPSRVISMASAVPSNGGAFPSRVASMASVVPSSGGVFPSRVASMASPVPINTSMGGSAFPKDAALPPRSRIPSRVPSNSPPLSSPLANEYDLRREEDSGPSQQSHRYQQQQQEQQQQQQHHQYQQQEYEHQRQTRGAPHQQHDYQQQGMLGGQSQQGQDIYYDEHAHQHVSTDAYAPPQSPSNQHQQMPPSLHTSPHQSHMRENNVPVPVIDIQGDYSQHDNWDAYNQNQHMPGPQDGAGHYDHDYGYDYTYDVHHDPALHQQYPEQHQNQYFQQHGLGVQQPDYSSHRLSMSIRPLPPNDPSEDAETRANRIRSFYKEYFDESRPNPHGMRLPQLYPPAYQDQGVDGYYEDYHQGYYGDGAAFDPQTGQFVVCMGTNGYGEPITRRAMTPPPRAPPRGMSAMSHRRAQKGPAPPPKALKSLPTPHKLKDDANLISPTDFAPPVSFRDMQAGRRPDKPGGGTEKPYDLSVPAFVPLGSSYDDLSVMPSPHALRKSSTFTALDFAPPTKLRDIDSGSDAVSIRSGRSGLSQAQVYNMRAGAYRVSRIPKGLAGTKEELEASLKPKMDLTRPG